MKNGLENVKRIMLAPVVLFGFNRADHMERVIKALSSNLCANESDLYVYIDKPNSDDAINIEKNALVLNMLERENDLLSSSFKSVSINVAEKHKGCKKSIIEGISEIIHKYGRVIVVEDDILTSKDFLKLMNDMLDFYDTDKRVFTVGGYSEPFKALEKYDKDVYALYRASSWGWATWVDRFDTIDFHLDKSALKDKETFKRLRLGGTEMQGLIKNEILGLSDAWDVQLAYAHAKQDKISIFPKISRAYNIGLDNTGTHCTDASEQAKEQQELKEPMPFKLEKVDIDKKIARELYAKRSYDYVGKLKRNFNKKGFEKLFKRILLKFNVG